MARTFIERTFIERTFIERTRVKPARGGRTVNGSGRRDGPLDGRGLDKLARRGRPFHRYLPVGWPGRLRAGHSGPWRGRIAGHRLGHYPGLGLLLHWPGSCQRRRGRALLLALERKRSALCTRCYWRRWLGYPIFTGRLFHPPLGCALYRRWW